MGKYKVVFHKVLFIERSYYFVFIKSNEVAEQLFHVHDCKGGRTSGSLKPSGKSVAAVRLRTLEWNSLLFCAMEFNSSLIFIYGRNKYVPRTLQELLIRCEKLQASHVVE